MMRTMFIYEPAMCCETGLCGVSVDPELLRISTITSTLKNNDITMHRYNLSKSPSEFISNKQINLLLHKDGVGILPITVIDGEVVKTGGYPTNEEMEAWFSLETNSLVKNSMDPSENCGCSDVSGCCNDSCCSDDSCC